MKQPDHMVSEPQEKQQQQQKKKRNTFLTRERMSKKLEVIRNVMKEVLCICNFLFQWEKGKQMWKSQKNKRTKDVLTSFVLFHYELS